MKPKTYNFISTVVILIFAVAESIWLFSIFGSVDYLLESIAEVVVCFSALILIILGAFKKKWVKQDSEKS